MKSDSFVQMVLLFKLENDKCQAPNTSYGQGCDSVEDKALGSIFGSKRVTSNSRALAPVFKAEDKQKLHQSLKFQSAKNWLTQTMAEV